MAVDNRTLLNDASATTGWTGDDAVTVTTAAGDFYEGGSALSTQLSNSLEHMYTTSIGGTRDLGSASVWFLVKDNLQQVKANGGGQIVIGDGTDRVGFYCNGNNSPGLSLPSYYNCLKLDVSNRSALSSNVYAGVLANLTVASITSVGYGTIHSAKANGAIDNVWMDASRFILNTSYALTINAGTVGTPIIWATVSGEDVTNGWGMLSNLQGNKFDINASWQWGDTANANSYFTGDNFQVFIDARDMGVGNFIVRTIAGTGTNSLVLTSGLFQNLGTPSVWDLSSTGMNILKFTAITFTEIGTIVFPVASATNRFANNCIFNNCGQIDFSTMEVNSPIINGSTNANGAVLLNAAGDSDAILDAVFNSDGTGHALEITAAGSYDFDNWVFTGYGADATANAVIRNSSGGVVTINVLNGGDTPTFLNSGGGSSTVINNSVTVTVGGMTEGAAVKVLANETKGTFTRGDTVNESLADSAGQISFSLNYEGAFGAGFSVVARARQQGLANAAIADDGGVLTNQTTNSNSATTDDMTLLPTVPVTNDRFYFGHNEQFSRIKIDVTNVNGGTGTIQWQYWNGAWVALSGVVDGTNGFKTLGNNVVSWTMPGDWADTTVNSQGPFRFVRAVFTSGAGDNNALARKCQLDVTRYRSTGDQIRTITSSGLVTVVPWVQDTISKFVTTD